MLIHACPDAPLENPGARCVSFGGDILEAGAPISNYAVIREACAAAEAPISNYSESRPCCGVGPREAGAEIPYAAPCIGDTWGELLGVPTPYFVQTKFEAIPRQSFRRRHRAIR